MVIEEFECGLGNLENLSAEPPDDALGRQEIVSLDAVLVGGKSDSDHDVPRLKCTKTRKTSQGNASGAELRQARSGR
jgi:hypothetical protein